MNSLLKAIVIILVLAYIISPDLAVGPIDDIIVALIGACFMSSSSEPNYDVIDD